MKNKLFLLFSVVVVLSMVLAACGPKPTEPVVTEPPATEPPVVTEPPATEPPVVFNGYSLVAPDCEYGGFFKSIEATDQYTVTFTMCKPDAAFLSKLAFSPFAIYPEEYVVNTAGADTRTSLGLEMPIGTGPYMVEEWSRGESITFKAYEGYWGEAPACFHSSLPLVDRIGCPPARTAVRDDRWLRQCRPG